MPTTSLGLQYWANPADLPRSERAFAHAVVLAGLHAQEELPVAMKTTILRGELREFGELLGEGWKHK
jgi:galactokinase/mevalonate kinase-like predicted kinase